MKTIRLKTYQIVLLIALIILIGLGVAVYLKFYPIAMRVKSHSTSLLATLNELNQMIDSKDLDIIRARALVGLASDDVSAIRSDVQPYYPLLSKITSWPKVGPYAAQVEPGLEYAKHLLNAANLLLPLTDSLTSEDIFSNRSSRLIQQINEMQSVIDQAGQELTSAREYYQRLQPDVFPQEYGTKIKKLEKYHPMLEQAISTLKLVPALTGAEKPVTYLVILQNSDELRPTGGFVTSYGLVRLEKGVVTLIDFTDSTETSYISEIIPAPAPLREILLAHYWLPRDANWSPSFPESAQKVQELYYLSTGIKTDGAIGMHQATIAHLLQFTGPNQVGDNMISVENVYEYMIQEKMAKLASGQAEDRKDFIEILVKAIIDQLPSQLTVETLPKFTSLLQEMVANGEVMAYSSYPSVQKAIVEHQLDGDLHPGDGDYLMLVDANIGYSKIDQVVTRSINYMVNLSNPQKPVSSLNIEYVNPMSGEVTCRQGGDYRANPVLEYNPPSCYWTYWRILVPAASEILKSESSGFLDSYFLEGYSWPHEIQISPYNAMLQEISSLSVVPVQSIGKTSIQAALPDSFITETNGILSYRLIVQKQPGVPQIPFNLSFALPDGYKPVETQDYTFDPSVKLWKWDQVLRQSITEINVRFQKGQ